MTKRLPDYFVKLHDEIRKDTHCGWSDSEKKSLIKMLTPNDDRFPPLFDMKVVPIQAGTTPSALEMALRFKYENHHTNTEPDTTNNSCTENSGFNLTLD